MAAIRAARQLVVGLGNRGQEYARTRHNVGFRVVERLAAEEGASFSVNRYEAAAAMVEVEGVPVVLLKPQAFMNQSGPAVAAWLEGLGLPASALILIHDDLDLPLGRLRVTGSAGSGGHRGVMSVQRVLGTQTFPRVRAGIGRPLASENAAEWVLEEFTPEELPIASEMVSQAASAVKTLVVSGLVVAMDRYNGRGPLPTPLPAEGKITEQRTAQPQSQEGHREEGR
ncbi:MAG TPA: aminoacyl-tRNA hydrolase [Candidatus Acidoferrum sp.]|nr:aminoacyl-tRNA hydrolase [Candidatus Methylomirabilis sp.]HWU40926.1 aminoacyl-tRNA hydrolase [Candidatus Acidoferrum sp.]